MRRAARVLALCGAALAMVACSSSDASSGATEAGTPGDDAAAAEDHVSGELTVYAAASLQGTFDEIIEAFSAEHPGITVDAIYDGSSTLVTQLEEGAEADVLATADENNMNRFLETALNTGDPELFATNTLVIAVPTGNPLGIEDVADLNEATFVICAPEVPCGNATAELFELYDVTGTPVSLEQNVTAVAERVVGGEVDAGLVYGTDVASRSDSIEGVVPTHADDVVNRYPIVTITDTPAATAFVDHVLSGAGRAVLSEWGFGAP